MSPSRQFAATPDGPALHRHMQRTASLLTEMQSNIVQLGNMLAMIQVQLDKLGPLDWLEAESLTFSRQAYWQMLNWLAPAQASTYINPVGRRTNHSLVILRTVFSMHRSYMVNIMLCSSMASGWPRD